MQFGFHFELYRVVAPLSLLRSICLQGYLHELNSGLPRTNSDSSRVEDLNHVGLEFRHQTDGCAKNTPIRPKKSDPLVGMLGYQ